MWDTKQADCAQATMCKHRGATKLSNRQILSIKTVYLSNQVFTK
jgi:hypothetical protein